MWAEPYADADAPEPGNTGGGHGGSDNGMGGNNNNIGQPKPPWLPLVRGAWHEVATPIATSTVVEVQPPIIAVAPLSTDMVSMLALP